MFLPNFAILWCLFFLIIYWIFRWCLNRYYSMILIWCYYLVSKIWVTKISWWKTLVRSWVLWLLSWRHFACRKKIEWRLLSDSKVLPWYKQGRWTADILSKTYSLCLFQERDRVLISESEINGIHRALKIKHIGALNSVCKQICLINFFLIKDP